MNIHILLHLQSPHHKMKFLYKNYSRIDIVLLWAKLQHGTPASNIHVPGNESHVCLPIQLPAKARQQMMVQVFELLPPTWGALMCLAPSLGLAQPWLLWPVGDEFGSTDGRCLSLSFSVTAFQINISYFFSKTMLSFMLEAQGKKEEGRDGRRADRQALWGSTATSNTGGIPYGFLLPN